MRIKRHRDGTFSIGGLNRLAVWTLANGLRSLMLSMRTENDPAAAAAEEEIRTLYRPLQAASE